MRLHINGTDYDRWENVPEQLRREMLAVLPDTDADGVPDTFEGATGADHITQRVISKVTVDGVGYDSTTHMPREVQDALRAAGLPLPGLQVSPSVGVSPQPVAAPGAEADAPQHNVAGELNSDSPRRPWWQFWRG